MGISVSSMAEGKLEYMNDAIVWIRVMLVDNRQDVEAQVYLLWAEM